MQPRPHNALQQQRFVPVLMAGAPLGPRVSTTRLPSRLTGSVLKSRDLKSCMGLLLVPEGVAGHTHRGGLAVRSRKSPAPSPRLSPPTWSGAWHLDPRAEDEAGGPGPACSGGLCESICGRDKPLILLLCPRAVTVHRGGSGPGGCREGAPPNMHITVGMKINPP